MLRAMIFIGHIWIIGIHRSPKQSLILFLPSHGNVVLVCNGVYCKIDVIGVKSSNTYLTLLILPVLIFYQPIKMGSLISDPG